MLQMNLFRTLAKEIYTKFLTVLIKVYSALHRMFPEKLFARNVIYLSYFVLKMSRENIKIRPALSNKEFLHHITKKAFGRTNNYLLYIFVSIM